MGINAFGIDVLADCPDADSLTPRQRFQGVTISEKATDWAHQNAPFDLLFIDANHSYESIKSDYSKYEHFVREKGFIAFHDCLGLRYCEGVTRFVMELSSEEDIQFHFICDSINNQEACGIAVMRYV